MNSFDLTGFVVLGIILIGLLYDLYEYRKSDGTTISSWVRTVSTRQPMIPFLFGLLVGHFFWYN